MVNKMAKKFKFGDVVYIATELEPYVDTVTINKRMRAMCGQGPFTIGDLYMSSPEVYRLQEEQPGGNWVWDARWLVLGTRIKDINPNEIESMLIKGE